MLSQLVQQRFDLPREGRKMTARLLIPRPTGSVRPGIHPDGRMSSACSGALD